MGAYWPLLGPDFTPSTYDLRLTEPELPTNTALHGFMGRGGTLGFPEYTSNGKNTHLIAVQTASSVPTDATAPGAVLRVLPPAITKSTTDLSFGTRFFWLVESQDHASGKR